MPIKNIGKYTRPGIYIEEYDNSIVELPIQDVLINLVPGFSKKGPINNPVYCDNADDFIKTFGKLDPALENKGSYFHRTALKMIESGPIWALNLMKTDSTRDFLNWKSISLTPLYTNGNLSKEPYENFFNRQDFWVRDSESFLEFVNNPTEDTSRLLHITNMGDKTITVLLFKSTTTGFDITAEDWYDGAINVPAYVDPKDYISDYLVTVLILSGDWTDYNSLSVDKTWSKYFTSTGLIKSKLTDFVNEKNVTVLGNYDASLIPNFRDKNGRDLYIKNVINNYTDKTGLFCAYNEDVLFGEDYQEGKLDLIGNSIVGNEKNSIDFLSYKETITESLTYNQTYLDAPSNVFSYGQDAVVGTRTGVYTNWTTYNFKYNNITVTNNIPTVHFNSLTGSFYILNGTKYNFAGTGLTYYDTVLNTVTTANYQRIDNLYLNTDNTTVNVLQGNEISIATNVLPEYTVNNTDTIHIGYVTVTNTNGVITAVYTPVTVDTSTTGFVPLRSGSINETLPGLTVYNSTIDVNNQQITIEFLGTLGYKDLTDYNSLRYYKIFDEISTNIENGKAVIIDPSTQNKIEIGSNYVITDYTTTVNSKIQLSVNSGVNYSTAELLIYYIDNEFLLGNLTVGAKTKLTNFQTSDTIGVVAKYSNFYQDFYNGNINDLDYFVVNNLSPTATGVTLVYLRTFIDTTGILTVNFMASKDTTAGSIVTSGWSTGYNYSLVVWSDRSNWKQTVEIELPLTDTDLTKIMSIRVDKNRYSEVSKGSFLEAYVDETDEDIVSGTKKPRRLTRVIKTTIDSSNSNYKILYTDSPIKIVNNDLTNSTYEYATTVYPQIDEYVTEYKGVALTPFTKSVDSMPNGTEIRQTNILSTIGTAADTALAKGLASKNKIQWRYLVDSFGLGLIENSKQEFVSLCGKKLNCFGFLNMPSARMFRKSSNPSFVNDENALDFSYIQNGGNDNKNPSFLYSFGTGVGESCTGYFFPYVKDSTGDIEKMIPPAAAVATTYMQKHITNLSTVEPWTICAGINDGKLDISGVEMTFTDDDLTYLNQMGANAITRNTRSVYYINTENTAQVTPTTSLSYIHSREVLIELENEMYDMLLGYQWKFNTASVRAEIKYKADKICKKYLEAGALYDYKNICDETNNTADVISAQEGALDTYIEIVAGMGVIVNNITIMGYGKIASGGFTAA
jgi:hypothetical protein